MESSQPVARATKNVSACGKREAPPAERRGGLEPGRARTRPHAGKQSSRGEKPRDLDCARRRELPVQHVKPTESDDAMVKLEGGVSRRRE
jgi:hypothetical protein